MKKKLLFHQDKAPNQKSVKLLTKIHELKFEVVPQAPCSSDLTLSDLSPFSYLEKFFAGKKCVADSEVIIADSDESACKKEIQTLDHGGAILYLYKEIM